jgi:hypothetical protein
VSERIELYYGGEHVPDDPANAGLSEHGLEPLMRRIREAGVAYRLVDVSGRSADELRDEYMRVAVVPSVRKRYRVAQVFGTHKYPGVYFGRRVPALVVLEDGRPVDVYPHEEEGRVVTIADYIERTGRGDEVARRVALVRRMNALRTRIGRVGVPTDALVEDGRRR